MALHENFCGRMSSSVKYAEAAEEQMTETEDFFVEKFDLAKVKISKATSNIHLGNFLDVIKTADILNDIGVNSGDSQLKESAYLLWGFAYRGLGELEKAIQMLQKALEMAIKIPDYLFYPDIGGELGQCYLLKGELDKAFSVFEDCRQIVLEHNLMKSPTLNRYINGYADACTASLEREGTNGNRELLKKAQAACKAAIKQGKIYIPEMPEALLIYGKYLWLTGKKGAAKKTWKKSIAGAERMELNYDLKRIHYELGRRTGSEEHLNRAKSIFEQTQSKWDLARTEEELAKITV